MSNTTQTIDGEAVTTKLAMRMEDSLHAFAVRAATFIGELDVPYSEEFDGHDFSATHIIAYVGNEPAGAVRLRWLRSFAMPERLAVVQRFRGHNIGGLLLERCRALAESRGCDKLYVHALPSDVKYWEKQGWRRLVAEAASSGPSRAVARVRAVDAGEPLPETEAPESVKLPGDAQADVATPPRMGGVPD
jgi:GNAT superfamily N-acetyltransferase